MRYKMGIKYLEKLVKYMKEVYKIERGEKRKDNRKDNRKKSNEVTN
ncbi:MAG: hypothetical protein ACI8WT_000751 [Clostridium sp.]|jgi:hypothetical protein